MSQENVEIVRAASPPSGTEIEDCIDVGDERVLVLIRDHVQPRGTDSRIESVGCNLVTLRDSKIARIDFYPSREQGLEAAGLRE